jgi:hypothetical protein
MFEEFTTATCTKCGKLNHVLLFYSGDVRANRDVETASCFSCREDIVRERCCWIFTGETKESAVAGLRRVQGRLA